MARASDARPAPAASALTSLDDLARALRCLPGVGPKAAQRMALHLLQHDRPGARELARALEHATQQVRHCERCNTFTEDAICALCRSAKRDPALLCVVETPADLLMVEQTQAYDGLYFVLMGRLSPLDGIGPREIGLDRLLAARRRRHGARGDPRDQFHQRRRSDGAHDRRAASARGLAVSQARARRAGRRRARVRRRRNAGAGASRPALGRRLTRVQRGVADTVHRTTYVIRVYNRRRMSARSQVERRASLAGNKTMKPAVRAQDAPSFGGFMTRKTTPAAAGTRRKFLKASSGAAAGAALGFPMIATGQATPIAMRWQSTWPAKDIFHEYANDFAKKVNDMTGGELKIEVLPAGAVVPAFGLLDAVSKGTLDGGHGVLVYHYGKQTALALWGSGPAFGMDANMLLSWHKYGGGKELLNKLYASIGANVVSFPYGPMPTQPLGWFKKPLTKNEDFKGLKFRTVGISIDVFTGLGAAVNALPGGEIVPAMDRGLLDAAEFNNASSDRILGFPDVSKVCMLQSYHQNAEQFEITFNKTKYDALPAKMKAIIENAVEAASADMSWKAVDRYSKDYIEMQQKQNVKFYKTPDPVLQTQLTAYDAAAAKKSAENPLFKEIEASQKAFAERAVRWDLDTNVNRRMAYNHYFAKAQAPAKKARGLASVPTATRRSRVAVLLSVARLRCPCGARHFT